MAIVLSSSVVDADASPAVCRPSAWFVRREQCR
jgi:hypothetical protein